MRSYSSLRWDSSLALSTYVVAIIDLCLSIFRISPLLLYRIASNRLSSLRIIPRLAVRYISNFMTFEYLAAPRPFLRCAPILFAIRCFRCASYPTRALRCAASSSYLLAYVSGAHLSLYASHIYVNSRSSSVAVITLFYLSML